MTKLFHRLSTRIVLEILLAVAVSAAIYAGANAALTRFFQQYATEPAVFRRLSDRHFQDLQRFADENHLVSTDGKPFTQWNDRYHYVSLMVIRQNLEAAVLMQEITREEADEIMNCVLNAER